MYIYIYIYTYPKLTIHHINLKPNFQWSHKSVGKFQPLPLIPGYKLVPATWLRLGLCFPTMAIGTTNRFQYSSLVKLRFVVRWMRWRCQWSYPKMVVLGSEGFILSSKTLANSTFDLHGRYDTYIYSSSITSSYSCGPAKVWKHLGIFLFRPIFSWSMLNAWFWMTFKTHHERIRCDDRTVPRWDATDPSESRRFFVKSLTNTLVFSSK